VQPTPFDFDLQLFADPPNPDPNVPPNPNPAPPNNDDLAKLSQAEYIGIIKTMRGVEAGLRGRNTTLENEKKTFETELGTLRTEKQKRDDDAAKARGDFEKVARDAEKRTEMAEAATKVAEAAGKAKEAEFAVYRKGEALRAQATKLGIHDPTIVDKFVDIGKLPDDPTLLASAVVEAAKKLKTDSAYLFKADPAPAPGATPPVPGVQPPFPYLAPPPLPQPGVNPPQATDARLMTAEQVADLDARFGVPA